MVLLNFTFMHNRRLLLLWAHKKKFKLYPRISECVCVFIVKTRICKCAFHCQSVDMFST